MKSVNQNKLWTLTGMWNGALQKNRREDPAARSHIWASELGGSYYDRYWRMKGRKPTTPPNLRSRRKFEGGNLAEWIIQQVLVRARILKFSQRRIEYDGVLKVTGKADFVAGGVIKSVPAKRLQDLPESFALVAEIVIGQLKEKYPDGMKLVNVEIKSCAGNMFDRYRKAPNEHHALQAFHYAFNTKRPTLLVYVSRDDFRITEWFIRPGSKKWRQLYEQDIMKMERVLRLTPAEARKYLKEPKLIWTGEKFEKNWRIEYSNYLTDYGFSRAELYATPAISFSRRLNNVVKKIKEGKPIDTKANKLALEEGYAYFPAAQPIIEQLQLQYANVTPEATNG